MDWYEDSGLTMEEQIAEFFLDMNESFIVSHATIYALVELESRRLYNRRETLLEEHHKIWNQVINKAPETKMGHYMKGIKPLDEEVESIWKRIQALDVIQRRIEIKLEAQADTVKEELVFRTHSLDILGDYPSDEECKKLDADMKRWKEEDIK